MLRVCTVCSMSWSPQVRCDSEGNKRLGVSATGHVIAPVGRLFSAFEALCLVGPLAGFLKAQNWLAKQLGFFSGLIIK